jgi:L,D-peptidoglycan transpeptidase YkuD (ErfK/YbiS/YcfS/YnhG family)
VAASRSSTTAAVTLWQRTKGCWARAAGPWPAHVGRNGLAERRREGDGTTPAGSFAVGPVMYGTGADPGVRYAYRRLACGDWWDGDPASPTYNRFRHVRCGAAPPFAGNSEALWRETTLYRHFAVIQFNADPVVAGRGSAMFIHVDGSRPTNGCVSLPRARLVALLRWLRPALSPRVVIGARAEIRRY